MKYFIKKSVNCLLLLALLFFTASCASTKVVVKDKERALIAIEKSILIIPPLSINENLASTCDVLGMAFSAEIPKLVEGHVVYAKNIKSLEKSLNWKNLVKNGVINIKECQSIAATVGCSSIFVCRLIQYKEYPPFKMVLNTMWIDVETGDVLARAYNNVDLLDFETQHKFATFAGHGPVKQIYEKFDYSTELKHTASLSPKKFSQYVAAHSTNIMFGDLFEVEWYKFWNIL